MKSDWAENRVEVNTQHATWNMEQNRVNEGMMKNAIRITMGADGEASVKWMEEVERDGFAWARGWMDAEEVNQWRRHLGGVDGAGSRNWVLDSRVRALTEAVRMREWYEPLLGGGSRLVRVIYFDKTPESNWLVPWHQDLSIAVKTRVDVEGYGSWSVKDGVCHVQPPVWILERMLTIRLHLDDADEANGCLKVLPGSHRMGKLAGARIQEERGRCGEVSCAAKAGDILIMRPLLLHASGKGRKVEAAGDSAGGGPDRSWHRRVLHMEFSGVDLDGGLDWV